MNRKNLCCLLLLIVPSLIFWGPPLLNDETLAYRDSARFYYRQFEWNKTQWLNGEIPLWNPQENLGESVVAEASSSVFYPIQLLFLLPGIKFSVAFVLYAAIHVYLAGVGTFFLAREQGFNRPASLFGAIAYSFSGSLIFQTCNIVFLVGGCWLPFCLWTSSQLTRDPSKGSVFMLAMFLALPVLGGDPQTAYHVAILAFILLSTMFFSGKTRDDRKVWNRALAGHLAAALLAIGLAAIQILPSWKATSESTRAHSENARSIWELVSDDHENKSTGFFGHPKPLTHHDHLYQFSQPPWSITELIWPNVSGNPTGIHDRWVEMLPNSGRSWTTSIYCGLLTVTLFSLAFIRRSQKPTDRWMKIGFVVFGLGSLGWYGLGWLSNGWTFGLREFDPEKSELGAPVGGLYWFFVVLLPGYVNFRYPAKLFLVATLLLCLIAAKGFDEYVSREKLSTLRKSLLTLFGITAIGLIGLWLFSIPINLRFDFFATVSTSEFGPFDSSAAWSAIIWGGLHSGLICFVAILVINQSWDIRWVVASLILILVVDLSLANRRLIITARSSLWDRAQKVLDLVDERDDRMTRIYRTDPMTWSTKNEWLRSPQANRLEQVVDYEVQTLLPRHHLASRNVSLVESFRSIESERFASLMAYFDRLPGITTNDSFDVPLAPNPIALGRIGCEYFLIPNWGKPALPGNKDFHILGKHEMMLVKNPYALSRFRVVPWVRTIPRLRNVGLWLSLRDVKTEFQNNNVFGDLEALDLVEVPGFTEWRILLEKYNRAQKDKGAETEIRVVQQSNTEIEIEISGRLGFLIVADRFDEDWKAYCISPNGEKREVDILQTNLLTRGIPLIDGDPLAQPDKLRVLLVYRPYWVVVGAWISGFSLLICIAFVGQATYRRIVVNES